MDKEQYKGAAKIGCVIEEVFQFLSETMLQLPNMELRTGQLELKVDASGISVSVMNIEQQAESSKNYNDYDEEGLLYDGD